MDYSPHDRHVAIINSPTEYTDLEGLRILVPREVYHPHEWSSTRFSLDTLPDVRGLDVLEIGGGSGALALAMRKRGAASVVATDISDRACATMECNALLNRLDIDVRQGDLFTPLRIGERFDLVIFNIPLMNKPVECCAEIALCDPDGACLRRFLQGLPDVTKVDGCALFMHATISAPFPVESVPGRIQTLAESLREDGEIFRILQWRR
jgi:release factor glutamine methyltransferase